jgi:predicted esterase
MIENCIIRHSRNGIDKPTHAIFLLHGRGGSAENMIGVFNPLVELNKLIIFSIQAENEWYPIPNGANDQDEAVVGLSENLPKIREYIQDAIKENDIPIQNTILIGFSAGAVVAIELAIYFQESYGLVVAHSGAILCPENVKKSTISTSFIVLHNHDDACFSWGERYLPMHNTLIENGYDVIFVERSFGNHMIFKNDIEYISLIVSQCLS